MIDLNKISNDIGAFTTIIAAMLLDKFGPVVTSEIIDKTSEYFKTAEYDLVEIESIIYEDLTLHDFLYEQGIKIENTDADSLFASLDFSKLIREHFVIYEYSTSDYKITVEFNMVEQTYQHYRKYRGGYDTDYDIEPVTHKAISKFMDEYFS